MIRRSMIRRCSRSTAFRCSTSSPLRQERRLCRAPSASRWPSRDLRCCPPRREGSDRPWPRGPAFRSMHRRRRRRSSRKQRLEDEAWGAVFLLRAASWSKKARPRGRLGDAYNVSKPRRLSGVFHFFLPVGFFGGAFGGALGLELPPFFEALGSGTSGSEDEAAEVPPSGDVLSIPSRIGTVSIAGRGPIPPEQAATNNMRTTNVTRISPLLRARAEPCRGRAAPMQRG